MKEELDVFEQHLKYLFEYQESHDKYSVLQNKASREIRQKQIAIKREILEQYREELSELDTIRMEAEEKYRRHRRLVKRVTIFDIADLGKILGKLITLFEGELYVYQNADCMSIVDNTNWESPSKLHLIINHAISKPEYSSKEELRDIENEGLALLLTEKTAWHFKDNTVSLYEIGSMGISKDKFNSKFSYVDDFLNYLVNYRYYNKLIHITYDELEELLSSYVNDNLHILQLKKENKEAELYTNLSQDLYDEDEITKIR